MENYRIINHTNMQKYFRQSKEFIFLDEIEVIAGKSAIGRKYLSEKEWYFPWHFPSNPVLPGVFQMEAMMQTGGVIVNTLSEKQDKAILFESAKNVKIASMLKPNQSFTTYVELLSYKRGIIRLSGKVESQGKITAQMEFTLIVPSELPRLPSQA